MNLIRTFLIGSNPIFNYYLMYLFGLKYHEKEYPSDPIPFYQVPLLMLFWYGTLYVFLRYFISPYMSLYITSNFQMHLFMLGLMGGVIGTMVGRFMFDFPEKILDIQGNEIHLKGALLFAFLYSTANYFFEISI